MEILAEIPLQLDEHEVFAHLRVSPESDDALQVRKLIAQVLAVARPKAAYRVCYVGERGADTVEIEGITFTSRVLRVNLDKVHRVFAYVATCGRELDAVDVGDDPLREYWLAEMKVMALRAASAYLKEHLDTTYQPGKMSGMAPGSLTDWPITQQTHLFALLGNVEQAIGVRLTDSFLMVPVKSLSGIYFPTEVTFQSCQLCPRPDCPGRSAPYQPHLWEERYAEKW